MKSHQRFEISGKSCGKAAGFAGRTTFGWAGRAETWQWGVQTNCTGHLLLRQNPLSDTKPFRNITFYTHATRLFHHKAVTTAGSYSRNIWLSLHLHQPVLSGHLSQQTFWLE